MADAVMDADDRAVRVPVVDAERVCVAVADADDVPAGERLGEGLMPSHDNTTAPGC